MRSPQQVFDDKRSDGCTNAPDLHYRPCCEQHDTDYTDCAKTRAQADRDLRLCMKRRGLTWVGRYVLPWVYWAAVRLFGASHWRQNQSSEEEEWKT